MTANSHRFSRTLFLVLIAVGLSIAGSASWLLAQTGAQSTGRLSAIDLRLPSESTNGGTLAVRLHMPSPGQERYPEGAPVLIWVRGGFDVGGINHGLPPEADGLICVTFLFPGGEDPWADLTSDGIYDYRGESCIAALRDVILYAAGKLEDAEGRTIDEISGVPVLHDNIGLIGESNGGNILAAVAALHGEELVGHLRYVIQWETPVSSQIATRDFGRVWLKPGTGQGDYWNPRFGGYDPIVFPVDFSDLAFDPTEETYAVIHDGTGDGLYTTVPDTNRDVLLPDLNGDRRLSLDEDFPLDTYPVDADRLTYSRLVMAALASQETFGGDWPAHLVTVEEANAYWDLRESVRLTERALANIPDLEAMILCGLRDHVQALPGKPHVRQAFDSWDHFGGWVKVNPSSTSVEAIDASLASLGLPNTQANVPPADWFRYESYAMPAELPKPIYELAAIYEMADRARIGGSSAADPVEAPQLEASPLAAETPASVVRPGDDAVVVFVESEEIGRLAVAIRSPQAPRYTEGAPVIVNVSGFFTGSSGFNYELDPDALGSVYVTYLWPGQSDPRTGLRSEGVFDYGGPICLQALRDVIRFAAGEMTDVDGRFLDAYTNVPVLFDVTGLYAFSHSGIVATNVLAQHGEDLQSVRFFVGRENPTTDALYPLEPGHWDDETGRAVHNPFYDPAGYTATSIEIDYSTVYWRVDDEYPEGRPAFAVARGPDYVCSFKHPQMYGKDYWSTGLLQGLLDNGSLSRSNWPETLATPEEAAENWPFRTTVNNYDRLGEVCPDLRVMLVFADDDHVQTAIDKPHIHHAYNGFHETARLWCRLNPDRAYVEAFAGRGSGSAVPDNAANREPVTWMIIRSWGYEDARSAGLNVLVPLASVAEMLDRTYFDAWQPNLSSTLFDFDAGDAP